MGLRLEGGCRELKKGTKNRYLLSTLSHPETDEQQRTAHLTFASKHLNFGLNKGINSPKSADACVYRLSGKSERLCRDWIKNTHTRRKI